MIDYDRRSFVKVAAGIISLTETVYAHSYSDIKAGSLDIADEISRIKVSDRLGAEYIFDKLVDSRFVAANPQWSFIIKTRNGIMRGFRLDETYLDARMFGYNGSGLVDEAPVLNAISSYLSLTGLSRVHLHGTCALSSTVFWPAHATIIGPGGKGLTVRPLDSASVFIKDYMFMFNTSDGTHWVTPNPINPGGCKNVRFSNPDGRTNVSGILFFGGATFTGVSGYLVAPLLKRGAMPQTGSSGEYNDLVKIEHLEADNPGLSVFAIDIDGPGDALEIRRCGFSFGTLGIRIRSGANTGVYAGTLDNIIGGDHLIEGGRAIDIRGMHNERGRIIIDGATVKISSSWFAPDALTRTPPIVLRNNESRNTSCILDSVEFLWGYNHFSEIPYEIAVGSKTTLSVRDTWKISSYIGSDASRQGIKVCSDEAGKISFDKWNNYSHLLSEQGRIRIGLEVPLNSTIHVPSSWPGISSVTARAPNNVSRKWLSGSDTYYYNSQEIYDLNLFLGSDDENVEVSRKMTFGANEIACLNMSHRDGAPTGRLTKIYRGNLPGIYNMSCLLPMMSTPLSLYDDGRTISSLPWVPRAPGTMDSLHQPEPGDYCITTPGHLRNVRHVIKIVEDESVALLVSSQQIILFVKPLSQPRTVVLPSTGSDGASVRVVRQPSCLGSSAIVIRKINSSTVISLGVPGSMADLTCIGGDWILTAAGKLP